MAGEEVTGGVVVRFGARSEEEMFFAEHRRPHVRDFDLGSDEERAAKSSLYAALSVWVLPRPRSWSAAHAARLQAMRFGS